MPPLNIGGWVDVLEGVINGLRDGSIAVAQIEGKTLTEIAELSKEGWDKFDQTIAEGEKAGHENDG